MAEQAKTHSEKINTVPTWRRVAKPADLTVIFDPGVQVFSWQRDIDPDITAYPTGLAQPQELQQIETFSQSLNPGPGVSCRSALSG